MGYGYKSNIYAENCWFADGVVVSKDYTTPKKGYGDYNLQIVNCHNTADVKQNVGEIEYFTPSNYYQYSPYDTDLVPTVVGNEKTGAGANLMVEVGKGVTGYADGSVVPDPDPIVDGIRSIENSELKKQGSAPTGKANSNYYNLSGQRVGNDYKGIVIRNGKKLVK